MNVITAPLQAILGTDAVAHVWTMNPDGTPQVSVVWCIARDDQILFGTAGDSIKARNLAIDPKVILSVEDTERNERGFQRHLVVHGRAVIETGPDPVLMDQLARKYAGLRRIRSHFVTRRTPSSSVSPSNASAESGRGSAVSPSGPRWVRYPPYQRIGALHRP